jgi:hypothetical protein
VYTFKITDTQYTAALPAQLDKTEKQWIRVRGMRRITAISNHNITPRFNKRIQHKNEIPLTGKTAGIKDIRKKKCNKDVMKNLNNCNYYAPSSLMFEQEDDG